MATYKPLQPNQTPTLGTSGAPVGVLQAQYNQANPTATPLAVDNLYGPKTAAALAPKNNVVVSGGATANEFGKNSLALDGLLGKYNQPQQKQTKSTVSNTNDAYTQMLDRLGSTSELSTKAMIGTIQAQRANRGAAIDTQYENYKRGLQSLGILHNQAQSTPDLLQGHIQQAENEHQAKLGQLDVEMNKALMDANSAKMDKNHSLLKDRMGYIDKLNKEKDDVLKNMASDITSGNTIAESTVAGDYDQIKGLSESEKQRYIQTVSASFGIPASAVQAAFQKEMERRADRELDRRGKESIMAERGKTSSSKSKLTEAEKKEEFYNLADKAIEDPANLDDDGYITAEAFRNILKSAQTRGTTRTNVIERYKEKLYLNKFKFAKAYGLTKAEFDKLTKK